MKRKKILEERLARLSGKKADIEKRVKESVSADEVRSLTEVIEDINADIKETQAELAALDEGKEQQSESAEGRDAAPKGAKFVGGSLLGSFGQKTGTVTENRDDGSVLNSKEYRMAFKAYYQRGVAIPAELKARVLDEKIAEMRAGGDVGPISTQDAGEFLPITVMNEYIKDVPKVYGQIFNKTRKLNIPTGVKVPIASLKADFKWITESTVSERQKIGGVTGSVEFAANMGEVRISQTLLSTIMSLEIFEQELGMVLAEAYVEAMEKGIFSGSGDGEMLGIFNDPRITNTVIMTAEDLQDWTAWRKKLFSKIPLSKRGGGEFVFPASTVESYLLTMSDANGRPIFKEATEITVTDSNNAGRFFGRETDLVEPDVIADFDTASKNEVIGVFWNPRDYAINQIYGWRVNRYYDNDKHQFVTVGLTVADGKILDTSGCYLIVKG